MKTKRKFKIIESFLSFLVHVSISCASKKSKRKIAAKKN